MDSDKKKVYLKLAGWQEMQMIAMDIELTSDDYKMDRLPELVTKLLWTKDDMAFSLEEAYARAMKECDHD